MTATTEPIGRGHWIRCDLEPTDVASVQAADSTLGRVVTIAVTEASDDRTVAIVLVPNRARALAAAILNEADLADRTIPLVFHPPSPEAEDPFEKGVPA